MEDSMSDPLGNLFSRFLKERVDLKAVTPKTRIRYQTAWKAFQASQEGGGDVGGDITKARLHAFVVHLRDRGVRPRSGEHIPASAQRLLPLAEGGRAPSRTRPYAPAPN
jgi:hypothetical protein